MAKWVFPSAPPFLVQGRDLSEDNFAQEDRQPLEIMIREVLQNPLDARTAANSEPVRVAIRYLKPGEFDAAFLEEIVSADYRARLSASGGAELPAASDAAVLVIEDFATTGLQGVFEDQDVDGPGENWNAFWFREGEGAKSSGASNGRAGQGKITYYRMGAARLVCGLTIRQSDSKELLMARSAFRRVYPFAGGKWLRHSFWCTGGAQPIPTRDTDVISRFRDAFRIRRNREPGLSLVIPFVGDFDQQLVLRSVVAEYYYPIISGNLLVEVNGVVVDVSTIDELAKRYLPDDVARTLRSSFSAGYRAFTASIANEVREGKVPVSLAPGWERDAQLRDQFFPEGEIEKLRSALGEGQRIAVRFPIKVKPKGAAEQSTWFDVYLEIPEELAHTEEAYIRRDLLIGSEAHLSASANLQKARALTLINEPALSAFLADAEEPTHLRWNASRPRLGEDYANPGLTLRSVRNAAPRLLALLSNGLVTRDMKTLARYFADPNQGGDKKTKGGGKKGGPLTPPPPKPPQPQRKPFRIDARPDGVAVLPNGSVRLPAEELPVTCTLELAYETLDEDPFRAYDPFDFNVGDVSAHALATLGVNILERNENRVVFDVLAPDFSFAIDGFDRNIRLRARLSYKEAANGASDSAN